METPRGTNDVIEQQRQTRQVGELVSTCMTIAPQTPVREVAELFLDAPELEAVTVVEAGSPLALVTRGKLFGVLLKPFAREVYARSPITEIADDSPMIVPAAENLDRVLDRAMQRPYQDIYDELVVTDEAGAYLGILSVRRLVVEQGHVLAHSIAQRELAWTRARELEKVSEIKSQFIAHVTHELRSPVNAIIGLAELMGLALDKGQTEQARQKLSLLASSATGLRAIITNILDLSKIEAGKMEFINEDFDLMDVLRNVTETTRVLLGNKPVEICLESPVDSLPMHADSVKIRQILTNLLSNAAKFTDSGRITLELVPGDDEIHTIVRDTGIGIRERDLQRLFTAFSQLEDAKTRRREGTGLGLTITRELVERLGGRIDVSSTFGAGTTFRVVFPLNISPSQWKETA